MLNEEKIKIMNKLAMYEQGEGKKYLPVSRYYRSDYIGLAMIKNFFLVTIGYCLILAGIAAYFAEYLIDNVHKMNLVSLGVEVILGYMHCCYLLLSYFLVGVGICMSGVSINVGWRSIRLPKKKKCINRKSISLLIWYMKYELR